MRNKSYYCERKSARRRRKIFGVFFYLYSKPKKKHWEAHDFAVIKSTIFCGSAFTGLGAPNITRIPETGMISGLFLCQDMDLLSAKKKSAAPKNDSNLSDFLINFFLTCFATKLSRPNVWTKISTLHQFFLRPFRAIRLIKSESRGPIFHSESIFK